MINPISCASCVSAQGTLRRVTFSVVSQPQDAGCYDSGLEDSETPSSKSSSGPPRLGALPLPEEGYERTTPEGSVGEEEHVENGKKNSQSHSIAQSHTPRRLDTAPRPREPLLEWRECAL